MGAGGWGWVVERPQELHKEQFKPKKSEIFRFSFDLGSDF
jgi:hypothetical protein